MASYRCRVNLTFMDVDGNLSKMQIDLGDEPDTVTLAGLFADLGFFTTAFGAPGTISNATIVETSASVLFSKTALSGALNATYAKVEDQARLQFANSAGDRASASIPSPISAVFHGPPNQDTVDPAGAAAPFIAAFTAHAGGPALLNIYEGGVKVARRARRRSQHRV